MINMNKSNKNQAPVQIVAGLLPSDSAIEFIGIQETQTVIWVQHGCAREFKDLAAENYMICWQSYHKDMGARSILQQPYRSLERQVELYIYYMCGAVDGVADLKNGKLNFSENLRTSKNCISLKFDYKHITIGGKKLTDRELTIIDYIKEDLPDKMIAGLLINKSGKVGVSQSTYDFHKRNLFNKIGVKTKPALMMAVMQHGI